MRDWIVETADQSTGTVSSESGQISDARCTYICKKVMQLFSVSGMVRAQRPDSDRPAPLQARVMYVLLYLQATGSRTC